MHEALPQSATAKSMGDRKSRTAGMPQRVIYGFIALSLLYILFLLDVLIADGASRASGPLAELLRHGSILPALFVTVMLQSALELNRMVAARGVRPQTGFALGFIVVFLLTPWLAHAGWLSLEGEGGEIWFWQSLWMMLAVMGAGVLTIIRRDPQGTTRDVGATLLMILYVGYLSSFGLAISSEFDPRVGHGAWLLLCIVLITKVSDIGAYLVGTSLGRNKLIPTVSQGKTVEGTVGGLVASGLVAVLFVQTGIWCEGFESLYIPVTGFSETFQRIGASLSVPGWLAAFSFGLIIAAAAQLGDLFESCIKRDAGSKDSASKIPHYGGILDLVDSTIFAMPMAWLILRIF